MEAIATGLIAVFGTLLGSVSTYWVQKRTVLHQQELARQERLRQERVSAYTTFAGALTDYRRARVDRYFAWRGANRLDPEEVRLEVYRLRAVAKEGEFRVHLLAPTRELIELATRARRAVDEIGPAGKEWQLDPTSDEAAGLIDDFQRTRDASRAAVQKFIDVAREQVVDA